MFPDKKMHRIAVFNMEIVGTVNPILPVVRGLVKSGCDVRYYLSKETFVKDVEAVGATAVTFDEFFLRWDTLLEEEKDWLEAQGCGDPLAQLTAEAMEFQFLQMRMLYFALPGGVCIAKRLVESWSSDWCPDLVLYNCMLLHPLLAANKLAIPSASFSTYPGPGTPMHLSEIPEDQREAFDARLRIHPGTQEANEVAKAVFGVDVCSSQLPCRFYSRQLNIVFSVPQLQGVVPDYQRALIDEDTFLWAGASDSLQGGPSHRTSAPKATGDDECAEPWIVPPGVKVVIVSLGSLTVDCRWDSAEHVSSAGRFTGRQFSERLWSELIEYFGHREELRFILSVGSRDAKEVLGELPSNFVAQPYIEQVTALQHADAFITHGGCNSIKEAALLGVPMIVVPFCVDQPSNGEAIRRLGAGTCFPDPMVTSRGSIAAALQSTLGDKADEQQRCSRMLGEALQKAGGAQAAVQACLNLVLHSMSAAGGA